MELIACKNLAVGYHGSPVQKNLNFSIHAGDYFCIVGDNGSGKSTLMKTLLHLLPPVAGELRYADTLCPKQIGYLPQQTQVQRDFPATVREIVLSGCLGRQGLRPFVSKAEQAVARQAMEQLGIACHAGACYRELSGGQQQRVLLARALCAAKQVLLLDEPVSGLDPGVTAEFYQLLLKLNREQGMTILMISHDLAAAQRYASRILQLGAAETAQLWGGDAHAG